MSAAQGCFWVKPKDVQFLKHRDILLSSAAEQSKSCQSKWCLPMYMKSCIVGSTLKFFKAYFSFIPLKLSPADWNPVSHLAIQSCAMLRVAEETTYNPFLLHAWCFFFGAGLLRSYTFCSIKLESKVMLLIWFLIFSLSIYFTIQKTVSLPHTFIPRTLLKLDLLPVSQQNVLCCCSTGVTIREMAKQGRH